MNFPMQWVVAFLLFFSAVCADELNLNRHEFGIGPDVYATRRIRHGGTKQNGTAIGVIAKYQRLKRYGWYWGLEGSWAACTLTGHTGNSEKIRSHLTDAWAEGRLGYTFQQKEGCQASFTPYIGVGYLWEKNAFTKPSPLPLHFKTRYAYTTAGFLLWMYMADNWEGGLNFRVRYPWEPRCDVSHDPDNAPLRQNIRERVQLRIEVPLTYRFTCSGDIALSLIPFYEIRRYGSHPNYPYNYYKNELHLGGAALELIYRL